MATFTNFDKKMFERAALLAEDSNFRAFHLGCVIVYKHKIIGEGYNSTKTHPVQKHYNRRYRSFKKSIKPFQDSLHAEIAALQSIPYPVAQEVDWKKVKVYVVRVREKDFGLARPCPACMAALREMGVRNFYYSTEGGFAYEEVR